MKILIIAAFFPPQNSIASLRPYSWAKWFSFAGHDVTVLTTVKMHQPHDLKLETSFCSILSLPLKIPFNGINNTIRYTESHSMSRISIKISIFKLIKKIYLLFTQKIGIFNACRYPDWHDIWAKDAINIIKKKSWSWDLVLSTGWPYSTHRIGLYLKQNNLVKNWIVDWRDLWTKNHLYQGLKIFHPYERYLENLFHKNANYITTVSEGLAANLKQITTTPVEVIYNGFDKDDFDFLIKQKRKQNSKFTIAYLGSIYRGFQDPEPLFIALKELKKEGQINSNQLEVVFAGSNANIIDIAEKHEVSSFYSYKGFLPREEALQLQYDADAVLFLEYNNPEVKGVLTGKLFEYLYISREIWAIGTIPQNASGELIINSNAGVCFGTDTELIKKYLLQVLDNKKHSYDLKREKRMDVINEFTRKTQAEKILKIIDKDH